MRSAIMRGIFRLAAAAVTMAVLVPGVLAQQPPPQAPAAPQPTAEVPETSQFVQEEWLSWRLPGWTFLPGLTLGAQYDSNVALADAPATVGATESDRLFQVQPFGRIEYHSARTTFTTGYRGYLRRYTEATQLNGFDQRMTASVRRRATRFVTLFANNSFHDVPTTDEVILNGVPFSRTGTRTNTFAGGVDVRLTRAMDLNVQYENNWVSFDRAEGVETFLAGGVVNGGRARLTRRLNPRLSLGAEYGMRLADINDGARRLFFQDAGVTAAYAVGPHTTVNGAAGVSVLRDRTLGEDRTGPFIRAGIVHSLEHLLVGGSFERSLVPAFGFGGSSSNQELSGFVRMPLAQNRAYIQASLAWRRSDPFLANELELDSIWSRTTVGYAVQRWLRLEGFHAYTRQDSIVTGGEIDRHRVGIQAVVAQPMRIR
jgi:hypothetical protein